MLKKHVSNPRDVGTNTKQEEFGALEEKVLKTSYLDLSSLEPLLWLFVFLFLCFWYGDRTHNHSLTRQVVVPLS